MAPRRRKPVYQESSDQRALIQWRDLHVKKYPGLHLLHSTLNGVKLHGTVAQRARTWARLKAEGAHEGVSDLLLPHARGAYHGLWIEAKRGGDRPGRATKEQIAWHAEMIKQGYAAVVRYGLDEMIAVIVWYYTLPPFDGLSTIDWDAEPLRSSMRA